MTFYNPALDGLRFFAFFLVFLHHAPWTPVVQPPFPNPWYFLVRIHECGWMGVDLFLCLSSYLITRLLWMEWKERGKVSILSFYCRRILRIWPLYFLVCFLGFYLMPRLGQDSPQWGTPEYHSFLGTYLIPHLAFYANMAAALHGPVASISLGPLWTVSLEEQFYLLCPLLLVLARFDKRKILAAGFGLLVVTVTSRFFFIQKGFSNAFIWVSLPTRLDPFVLGSLLALFEEELLRLVSKIPPALFMTLGICCIVGAMAFPDKELQRPSVVWLYSLLDLGWIFILFSTFMAGWLQRGIIHAPFPFWGKVSYGLYVYHAIALHFASMAVLWFQEKNRLYLHSWTVGWSITLLAFLLTLTVAFLSYSVYEKPFLRIKKRFTFIRSMAV